MPAPLFVMTLCGLAFSADAPAGAPAMGVKTEAAVKELSAQDFPFPAGPGDVTKPFVIACPDDLAKAVPDAGARDRLKKEVHFAEQQLLLFAWSGPGGDRLLYTVGKGVKGPAIIFHHDGGQTDDLRPHVRLFAIPRDTTWAVLPSLTPVLPR